ncbi:MAG: GspE/PulE/PilB domain-containing protein, partial [Smithellaceae bacterium]
NLYNAVSKLIAVTKKLKSKIKQDETSSDKIGHILASKKTITVSDLSEALERQKREPAKSPGQILYEMGFPLSNSHVNLYAALSNLTAVAKKLESKIKQDETSSDKIGQILVSKKIITEADLKEALERKKREPNLYLGQILCEMGFPQSRIMKGLYYSNKRKKLGEILVELNIITEGQLNDILKQQKQHKNCGIHQHIGTLLTKNKTISEKNYINALSAHFNMPIVDLKDFRVSPSLQKAIGEQYALRNRIVVLSNRPGKLTVAIAEPHLSFFDYLEKAMPKGKHILFCLAKASEIEHCLDNTYNPYRDIFD